jgi:hypothetical protein
MDGTKPDTTAFRDIPDFHAARTAWPRGAAPQRLRDAASNFRQRFKAEGMVVGVKTVDLVSAAYPTVFAFHGAALSPNPYCSILNRLVLVRFEDFTGRERLLAWEPTIPDGSAKAPFFAQLIRRYGEFLSRKVFATEMHTLQSALAGAGVTADEVDYVAFDHLHVQDLRMLLGDQNHPPVFPNARLLVQQAELDTLLDPHPMQHAWYVPGGAQGVPPERVLCIAGDAQLGRGLALINTPGHTDGNWSLVINTPDGIWVTSENGVSIDNWFPEHSRIPGVARYARFYGREVVINANTQEDPIDQYNSMVLEKSLADTSHRDSRFTQVLPSTELLPWIRNWPVRPSLFQGGLDYGRITGKAK